MTLADRRSLYLELQMDITPARRQEIIQAMEADTTLHVTRLDPQTPLLDAEDPDE